MKRHDDHAELDVLLRSESQQMIQRAVKSLPEESLSLAWRSALNEKLRQARPISRWRTRFAVAWRPALALALTGCLAAVLMMRNTPIVATRHNEGIEASLVSVYDDSANSDELAGSGLAYHEVNDTTKANNSSSDWSESDLTSL